MAKSQNTTSGEASLTKIITVSLIAVAIMFGGMKEIMAAPFWDDLNTQLEK